MMKRCPQPFLRPDEPYDYLRADFSSIHIMIPMLDIAISDQAHTFFVAPHTPVHVSTVENTPFLS